MKHLGHDFADVREMIRYLDRRKEGQVVNGVQLLKFQAELDQIDEKYKFDPKYDDKRFQLYELQALIHYFGGSHASAIRFVEDANSIKPISKEFTSKIARDLLGSSQNEEKMSAGKDNRVTEKLSVNGDHFFYTSPIKAALLSFFTLSIYNLYWFYKHWRSIQLGGVKKRNPLISVLLSIFQFFTVWTLFRRISESAKVGLYSGSFDYRSLSILYMVLLLVSSGSGRISPRSATEEIASYIAGLIMCLGSSIIIYFAQKAANYSNEHKAPEPLRARTYAGEVIFAVIGIILFLAILFVTIYSSAQNAYPQGTENEIAAQKIAMDQLTKQYNTCSSDLVSRYDGIDRTNQNAIDSYNADYDACEAVRLKQNEAVDQYNRLAGLR